jgi:sodium-coupled monocarboxylate transporter 8/12
MAVGVENKHLGAWDYVVFAAVLAISAGIGVWFGCTGGKQKTTREFLMADRQMNVVPVALSMLASFMSAITLLGTPSEIYVYGTEYWIIWIGYALLIPLAAHVFVPIFFRLKLTSVFEYMEMRFSPGMRLSLTIAFIVQMVLYMAIVLYAPSLALSAVTDFNVWYSVVSVGLVCTFYTTLGGMKAVMWTDVFQITLMFAGLIAILIQGSIDQGGFGNVWKILDESGRVEFFKWDPNPLMRHNAWSLTFGGAFTWLAIYGVNQAQIQRTLTVPKLRSAQMAMWINLFGLTALLTICALCGAVVYAEYKDCDPLTTTPPRIAAKDQLLPLYVMDRLSQFPGLAGLFTACLFSGALSTISSGLNSLSAVTLQDIVRPRCFKKLSESRATLASKILALAYGLLCLALTFVASQLGGVLQAALGLFGMIGGPQLGVYTLGIIYPCATWQGAYAGFYVSLILTLWVGIGANVYKPPVPKKNVSLAGCPELDNFTDMTTSMSTAAMYTTSEMPPTDDGQLAGYTEFYALSYMWYSAFAVAVCCIVGLAVSFCTGMNKDKPVDPKLICPIFDTFCCYLPQGLRKSLRCGINHKDKFHEEEAEEKRADKDLSNGVANPTFDDDFHNNKNDIPPKYDDSTIDGYTNQETFDTPL